MDFQGLKIAVIGMGRSGVAVASAAKKRGAIPVVYDQQPALTEAQLAYIDCLNKFDIPVMTSWHGRLVNEDYDLLITSPSFSSTHPAVKDALRLEKPIFSEIEFAYQISRAPIIAITGTNGKSTTTVMTWLWLSGLGKKARLCGNIYGSGYPELTLTEAADQATSEEILVAEISSFQLEWVKDFRPRVSMITNITPDHLDRHKTFENYLQIKRRIFQNMNSGDTVLFDMSEKSLEGLSICGTLKDPQILKLYSSRFGFSDFSKNFVKGAKISNIFRTKEDLMFYEKKYSLASLGLLSEHNIQNALSSLNLVDSMFPEITEAQSDALIEELKRFSGLAHRMELLGTYKGVQFINNSMCTNPGALLTCMKNLPKKQHLLIGGDPKGLNYVEVGEYLRSSEHKVYFFGPENSQLINQIGSHYPWFCALQEAFEEATIDAKSGEAVVLSPGCRSAPPYINFHERGRSFAKIVFNWLEEKNTLSMLQRKIQ